LAGCLSLTACDASPYAVSVNGHVIKEITLNQDLKEFASNSAFVSDFQQPNSSTGATYTVAGAGGKGTYSSEFVSYVLSQLILASVIQQHLQTTNTLPDPGMVVAARGISLSAGALWTGFPLALRDFLTTERADFSAMIPASSVASAISADQSDVEQAYTQSEPFIFAELCVLQASAFSASQAQTVVADGVANGANICYDQAQLEAQPASYQTAVTGLTKGQVSQPIKTNYGFEVVKLISKQTPGYSLDVQRTLVAAIQGPPNLGTLLTAAHVKVNPAYGTWDASTGQVNPAQVKSS
jgi:hypothetical protein